MRGVVVGCTPCRLHGLTLASEVWKAALETVPSSVEGSEADVAFKMSLI